MAGVVGEGDDGKPSRYVVAVEEKLGIYAGIGTLGMMCTTMLIGKLVRFKIENVRHFCIPSSLIAAIIALGMWNVVYQYDTGFFDRWREHWVEGSILLLNLTFACLSLSIRTPTTFRALLHEALPQLLFGQVVCWGEYCVAIVTNYIVSALIDGVSQTLAVMVTIGFEGGSTTVSFAEQNIFVNVDLEEAEETLPYGRAAGYLGLISSLVFGLIVVNNLRRSDGIRAKDTSSLLDYSEHQTVTSSARSIRAYHSLSLHLGLAGMTMFIAFMIDLVLVVFDTAVNTPSHFLSYIPLISLTMLTSQMVNVLSRKFEGVRVINRSLFARFSVLLLELLVIVDISTVDTSLLRDLRLGPNTTAFIAIVVALILWNIFCFSFLAKRLCPNCWPTRALAECTQAMGLTWTGLLFVAIVDPNQVTPVPFAYASKQIFHQLVMSGGVWSTHSFVIADRVGASAVLAGSACALLFWLAVYACYVKPRMPRFDRAHRRLRHPKKLNLAQRILSRVRGETADSLQQKPSGGQIEDFRGRTPVDDVLLMPRDTSTPLLEHPDSGSSSSPNLQPRAATGSRISPIGPPASPGLAPAADDAGDLIMPELEGVTHLLDHDRLRAIVEVLPTMRQLCERWRCVYNLRSHGSSINTLYRRTSELLASEGGGAGTLPCVYVIQDTWGYVFGAFVSSPPTRDVRGFVGDGEAFCYSFEPKFCTWGWTGRNDNFARGSETQICFGGPEPAIALDDSLESGRSERSPTFANEVLSSRSEFRAVSVEVWALC